MASPLPTVRRIVTGHTSQGQSTVLSDSFQPPTGWGGFASENPKYDLHYAASVPAAVDSELHSGDGKWVDEVHNHTAEVYSKAGVLFRACDFAPGSVSPVHRTQSLDYGIVVKGSVVLVMEDGRRVTLQEGDTVVQRGTMHSWRNESSEWARVYFIALGAKPVVLQSGHVLGEEWMT